LRKEDFSAEMPGRLVPLIGLGPGVDGFVPDPLKREIELPTRIAKACENAAVLLGWVAGAGDILDPWLDLFLRREAIASSAIEGTFTTAHELYLFEAIGSPVGTADQKEVHNYVVAMEFARTMLKDLPLSLRVMKEAHRVMLQGVRGADKRPGEFRVDQNWIGMARRPIVDARFVPPPAAEMNLALNDLERFLHDDTDIPNLIRLAMIHYQFETIHPFSDGNGRIGRLLLPLLLCEWGVLPTGPPRIYLSSYFQEHDGEYRDLLLRVSQRGDWLSWFRFFVEAIRSEAEAARRLAEQLKELREKYKAAIKGDRGTLHLVVDRLFTTPVMQVKDIAAVADVTPQHARNYAKRLCELGITVPGKRTWGRYYIASGIIDLFFKEKVHPAPQNEDHPVKDGVTNPAGSESGASPT
jgi:Fic family protein